MTRGPLRSLIPIDLSDLATWPEPNIDYLSQKERDAYNLRRRAVEMYAEGDNYEDIHAATRKKAGEVRRLVKRCVKFHNGSIIGFVALLPGRRTERYTRKKEIRRGIADGSGGCAGALSALLEKYPDLETHVSNLLFKRSSEEIHEARIPYTKLHKRVLRWLRDKGFSDSDWPFCTKNAGYEAIRRYCHKLREDELDRWILVRSGKDASRRSNVGNGYLPLIPARRPLEICELDFHKVDAATVILITTPLGEEIAIPLSRWHIGILVCEGSRAILGYAFAFELTPSSDSLLEVVESALGVHSTQPGAIVSPINLGNNVLPNQIVPQLQWLCFSVLRLDNAWANLSTVPVNQIVDLIGCAVNYGPIRAWWHRPVVERIFEEVTKNGAQRLPSTFGTGSSDTKRDNPNKTAIELQVRLTDLTAIIETCIRDYNDTPTEGLYSSTPLSMLRNAVERGASAFFPQPLPKRSRIQTGLTSHVVEAVVRGSLKKNIRPYIEIDRCRYTNQLLSCSYNHLNKRLVVYINRLDVSDARAVLKDTGEDLGKLVAESKWRKQGVSVRDRKKINQLGRSKRLHFLGEDAIASWGKKKKTELLEKRKSKASKNRSSKSALELARTVHRQKIDTCDTEVMHDAAGNLHPGPDPFGLTNIPDVLIAKKKK
ncbi:hypothetical protein [Noviherbaspirillum denitrificans]|uniref:hypothetical protein n=1 Tax=Noviherbaspirillum denitrificans TaxID=1968433 RepID=UPI001130F4B2|nr:hypothetical protein [Noviherbaspirillum denitrificans]